MHPLQSADATQQWNHFREYPFVSPGSRFTASTNEQSISTMPTHCTGRMISFQKTIPESAGITMDDDPRTDV